MDGKRRWLGWIAVGLGAAALLVALFGRGFGSQIGSAGRPDARTQQQHAQPQNGPGYQNAQPGAGPQNTQPMAQTQASRIRSQALGGKARRRRMALVARRDVAAGGRRAALGWAARCTSRSGCWADHSSGLCWRC